MSYEMKACNHTSGLFHLLDQSKVTVQPAGPAGKRNVFLTLTFDDDTSTRQVELVLSEHSAKQLAEALSSGALGVMREFHLSADEPD